jgi:hypothetical protein
MKSLLDYNEIFAIWLVVTGDCKPPPLEQLILSGTAIVPLRISESSKAIQRVCGS